MGSKFWDYTVDGLGLEGENWTIKINTWCQLPIIFLSQMIFCSVFNGNIQSLKGLNSHSHLKYIQKILVLNLIFYFIQYLKIQNILVTH